MRSSFSGTGKGLGASRYPPPPGTFTPKFSDTYQGNSRLARSDNGCPMVDLTVKTKLHQLIIRINYLKSNIQFPIQHSNDDWICWVKHEIVHFIIAMNDGRFILDFISTKPGHHIIKSWDGIYQF